MTVVTAHVPYDTRCADCRKPMRANSEVWLIDGRVLCATCKSNEEYGHEGL